MVDKKEVEKIRKIIHDLRAAHHGAYLNAQAAEMISKKIKTDDGKIIDKHVGYLKKDLKKFIDHLNDLSALIKKGF